MKHPLNRLTDSDSAGLRLLASGIRKAAGYAVGRYKSAETHVYAMTLNAIAADLVAYADGGAPFFLSVEHQTELFSYHLTDKAYADLETDLAKDDTGGDEMPQLPF